MRKHNGSLTSSCVIDGFFERVQLQVTIATTILPFAPLDASIVLSCLRFHCAGAAMFSLLISVIFSGITNLTGRQCWTVGTAKILKPQYRHEEAQQRRSAGHWK